MSIENDQDEGDVKSRRIEGENRKPNICVENQSFVKLCKDNIQTSWLNHFEFKSISY